MDSRISDRAKSMLKTKLPALVGVVALTGGAAQTSIGDEVENVATARVVIFMDEGCPIARYHTRTLRLLHNEFSSKGVVFEGAFPNATATAKSVAAFAEEFELPFKTTVDKQQALAKELKAKVVPEAFVFDAEDHLVYRGRIDDTFLEIGRRRPVTRSHDLRDALTAIVSGKVPEPTATEPVGCAITFTQTTLPSKPTEK